MDKPKYIFWFRNDLRISDNPGLSEAAKNGLVLPIYILEDDSIIGSASKFWLYHSLKSLNSSLNNNLNFYKGDSKQIINNIIKDNDIKAIYWNRIYDQVGIKRDIEIKAFFTAMGIECKSFSASLLWEPWEVLKPDKTPYRIYTYFYKNGCLKSKDPRTPIPAPANLNLVKDINNKNTLGTLSLLPKNQWYKKLEKYCDIGESAANSKLLDFLKNGIKNYKENRNFPYKKNVSKLSPNLHFGEISPNQIWYAVHMNYLPNSLDPDAEHFLMEIAWREFSYYLLYHFPDLSWKNFQPKFDNFPWGYNENLLNAWKKGQTGYPIVDAGMRELWETGSMHNRVRMIVGSFLVKNLLLHWHHGRDWFWDCLVDADLANNSAGWQWIAGSGADAAPYFRIFNPITQGERFDPDGSYIRKFIPELSKLPIKFLFNPWLASKDILDKAGITLGRTYPNPIIDLEDSRNKALANFKLL
jgi:deoxyribodipyrimidine photo-lyase